jgi:hypothetical protein
MKSLTMNLTVRLKEVHCHKAEKQARDGQKQPKEQPLGDEKSPKELRGVIGKTYKAQFSRPAPKKQSKSETTKSKRAIK